jgi:hypothetical protein
MSFRSTSSAADSAVMQLLLAQHPTLLSRSEIGRELGTGQSTDDTLSRFESLGLVHRIAADSGEFFLATRTAMAAEEAITAHVLQEQR